MEDTAWAPPELHCRHLLVCRTVWYDAERPEEGFSLGKLKSMSEQERAREQLQDV